MKMNLKNLLIVLMVILQVFLVCSCNNSSSTTSNGNNSSVTSIENSDVSAEESATEPTVDEYLEQLTEGKKYKDKFVIASVETFNNEYLPMYFYADELKNEPFNDAAYERNSRIEDLLGVEVLFYGIGKSGTELPDAIIDAVNSDQHDYDLIVPHSSYGVVSMMTAGVLYNWNDIPYVDFTKDWWLESAIKDLSVNNLSAWAVGDLTIGQQTPVWMIFNKELARDYGKEDLYTLVLDNKWTLDKMGEYTKDVTTETSDKSVFGGQLPNALLKALMISTGSYPSSKNENDELMFAPNVDRLSKLYSKLESITSTAADMKITPYDAEKYTDFINGDTLLLLFNGGHYTDLRNIAFDFGIVPLPKLDENQENYRSMAAGGLMALPINTEDIEYAGLTVEVLNALSSATVRPAFYDAVLYNRCLQDDNSKKMMDVLLETQFYTNVMTVTEIDSMLLEIMKTGNVQSYVDANSQKIKTQYEQIVSGITKNK